MSKYWKILVLFIKVSIKSLFDRRKEKLIEGEKIPEKPTQGIKLPGTEHFNIKEFTPTVDPPVEIPVEYYDNLQKLMNNLEVIRMYIGKPVLITSGYRTEEYNKQIGGSTKSTHLTASGCDFVISGLSISESYNEVMNLIFIGKIHDGGLGRYNRHIHYDIGESRRWEGKSK